MDSTPNLTLLGSERRTEATAGWHSVAFRKEPKTGCLERSDQRFADAFGQSSFAALEVAEQNGSNVGSH